MAKIADSLGVCYKVVVELCAVYGISGFWRFKGDLLMVFILNSCTSGLVLMEVNSSKILVFEGISYKTGRP
jgi:hypothetical protein